MKKTMRKSALLSSVAMLLVSCIVLTSATYAWFAAAKKVTVDTLSASVQKASGLQISAWKDDLTKYGNNVSMTDLSNAGESKLLNEGDVIKPVTTADTTAFVTGEFDDNNNITFATAPDGSYYKIRVYLKAAEGMTVDMAKTTISFENGISVNPMNAFKAAVVVSGAETGNGTTFVTFDAHTSWTGTNATGGSYTKDGANGNANITGGTTVTAVEGFAAVPAFKLVADTAATVDVFVWLEGQDPDCTEMMANGKVTCNLAFNEQGYTGA